MNSQTSNTTAETSPTQLRYSAASAAYICHEGKMLVEVNRSRYAEKGEVVLTPLGGGIEVFPTGRALLSRLQIDYGNKYKVPTTGNSDLRFYIPVRNIPRLRRWVIRHRNTHREFGIARELREELHDEHGIKLPLPDDYTFLRRNHFLRESTHPRHEGKPTLFMQEVFAVALGTTASRKLQQFLQSSENKRLRLITEEEVRRCESREGEPISVLCQGLLQRHHVPLGQLGPQRGKR